MKALIKLLLFLLQVSRKGTTPSLGEKVKEDLAREFQIGDKVKKTIYVGYKEPGQPRVQFEELIYGKIIFIHDGYAYVKYRGTTMEGDEFLTDLSHVSSKEWKQASS